MRVTLESPQDEVDLNRAAIARLVGSLGRAERAGRGRVSVVFVDDSYMRDLKERYFGVRRTTDVIAFPLASPDDPEPSGLLGEVYVSAERAAVQARHHHVSLSQEVARLIVHGLLHVLGYRDDTPSARRVMIRRQEAFLREHKGLVSQVAARRKRRSRR